MDLRKRGVGIRLWICSHPVIWMVILVLPVFSCGGKGVTGGAGGNWATAQLLETDNAGDAQDPHVTIDAIGNAVVAWYQGDGIRDSVWSVVYREGTKSWSSPVLLESNDAGDAFHVRLAGNSGGDAQAVWFQYDGAVFNIWANRYDFTSATWDGPVRIEDDDAGNAGAPDVGMDENDNAIAVWQQSDGTRDNIWGNRYDAGAGAWVGATLIESDPGPPSNPRVAVSPGGQGVAVWSQLDGAFTSIRTNRWVSPGGWGASVRIDPAVGDAFNPMVSIDNVGNAVAVWVQNDGTVDRIFGNRFSGVSSSWGTAEVIGTDNSGNANHPVVRVDGNGNAIAVWYQFDGTRNRIWANRYTAALGAWGVGEKIGNGAGDARFPSIAMDLAGNAVAVWYQAEGATNQIWASRYDSGQGVWGAAERISSGLADARMPLVAMNHSGRAIASWHQADGIRDDIWANIAQY